MVMRVDEIGNCGWGYGGWWHVFRCESRKMSEWKCFREVNGLWNRSEGVSIGRDGSDIELWYMLVN